MYTKASGEPHCTGIGRRYVWNPEAELFEESHIYKYARSELEWLAWRAEFEGVDIKHKWNTGKPIAVHGQYPDGYCAATKTCYYFDGCYWHGHGKGCGGGGMKGLANADLERLDIPGSGPALR